MPVHMTRAAAHITRRFGESADNCQPFHILIKRQYAVILQKNRPFCCRPACQRMMCLQIYRGNLAAVMNLVITVHHMVSDLIQCALRHIPIVDRIPEQMAVIVFLGQFHIQACQMPFYLIFPIMDRERVRHDKAVIAELFAQLIHDLPVLMNPFAIYLVIASHHCPWVRLLENKLEHPQIHLVERPFIHYRIGRHTLILLIIADKMFQVCRHMLALDSVNVCRPQF